MPQMAIKRDDIERYEAAGFTVQIFVDLPGTVVEEVNPAPRRRRRTTKPAIRKRLPRALLTTDNSIYKFPGKAPNFNPDSKISRAYELLMVLFRGTGSQRRYRHQLTTYLTQHMGISKSDVLKVIASLRDKGYLNLEEE